MNFRIWRVSETDKQVLEDEFLSASEQRRMQIRSLRRAEDQMQRLCADALARQMLSQACAISPGELQFDLAENGKPFVRNCAIHFNLSHSADFVLCAVDPRPIGVDIEALRPIKPSLIQKVCSPDEIDFIASDPGRFLQVWTTKEALLKYRGTGICTDLRRINVCVNGTIQLSNLKLHTELTDQYALTIVYE